MEKAKILVVEDEVITAKDLQMRLQHLGYDVPDIVTTGENAINKAGEISPDLVLMDIRLADEIDGIEAVRQIRLTRDIPVIYLSAYTDNMISERAKVTEPFGFLSKPFTDYDLRNTIEMALYKHGAEKELRQEKEFTEKTIDAQIDTFFVLDPGTGKAIRWNSRFREITGYTDEEIADLKAPDSYYSQEDLEKSADIIEVVMSKGQAKFEMSLICKDGRRVPTEYLASAIKDDENNIKYIISIGRDITERKKTEEALQKSEERFRNLVETTSDWIWEVDENAVYTYVSPKIRDMLGYEPEEVVGKTPFDIMPPEEAKRVAEIFNPIVASHKPFKELENANLHKNGRLVLFETSGIPFFNADGKLCGYRGIDRDITDRKKAEEEREQLIQDLKNALVKIKTLGGLIPICSSCQRIRDDKGYWKLVADYMSKHSDAQFSHGICPECAKKLYPKYFKEED